MTLISLQAEGQVREMDLRWTSKGQGKITSRPSNRDILPTYVMRYVQLKSNQGCDNPIHNSAIIYKCRQAGTLTDSVGSLTPEGAI
jgi:hypothetical protein